MALDAKAVAGALLFLALVWFGVATFVKAPFRERATLAASIALVLILYYHIYLASIHQYPLL
jgi:hypothetical protein